MNYDEVTVQDCIEMAEYKGQRAIIMDGGVTEFVEEGNNGLCKKMPILWGVS